MVVAFFFFQAEDGIRDRDVTGVQTCALPICPHRCGLSRPLSFSWRHASQLRRDSPEGDVLLLRQIGRASCRERVEILVVAGAMEGKTMMCDGVAKWRRRQGVTDVCGAMLLFT